MGISKGGDQHVRTLLVHGARSVVRVAAGKTDALSRWINGLRERRGVNRTIVTVANKNARIIWAMLRKGIEFQPTAGGWDEDCKGIQEMCHACEIGPARSGV